MKYRVSLETRFEQAPRNPAEEQAVVAFLERVFGFLEEMGGEDPDAGGAMATGEVRVSVTVDATDLRDAFQQGAELIQRAIQRAGVVVEDRSRERFVVEPEETPEPLVLTAP